MYPSRYNVQINVQSESDMAGVASTLEGYVLRDQLAPSYAGSTDSAGTVAFPASGKMQQGLYLVLGERYMLRGLDIRFNRRLCSFLHGMRLMNVGITM